MTSHASHDMTQHKQSHRIKWRDHYIKWHDMTCHVTTNHRNSSSPHVTSQPTTLLHLTPQATSWHQNRSHYHRGTAESLCTAKKWFGHGAGRSPCAQSIGKFFLCYILFFLLKLPPPARPGTTCIFVYTLSELILGRRYVWSHHFHHDLGCSAMTINNEGISVDEWSSPTNPDARKRLCWVSETIFPGFPCLIVFGHEVTHLITLSSYRCISNRNYAQVII